MQALYSAFPQDIQAILHDNGETATAVTLEVTFNTTTNKVDVSLVCGDNTYPMTGISNVTMSLKNVNDLDNFNFVTSSVATYSALKVFGATVRAFLMG